MPEAKKGGIKDYWNHHPVGETLVDYGEGGIEFFKRYDDFRYRTEGHILQELDNINFENKDILEIGIGQAADAMQMIKRGANYHGIDLTEKSVSRVTERFRLFNLNYKEVQVANAEKIPYADNTFDIVYSHGVIHHSPNIETIVNEIHRVLKPGGEAVIMLYHKNSFNYYISIGLIRRMGLIFLMVFPFLSKVLRKITGEDTDRINAHRTNFRKEGLSYLKMNKFIHRSTDGPFNLHSSVWTRKSVKQLFKKFSEIQTSVHFLNQRHMLGLQYLLTEKMKQTLSSNYGWHLWIKAKK